MTSKHSTVAIFLIFLLSVLPARAQGYFIPPHKGYSGFGCFVQRIEKGGSDMVLTPEIEWTVGGHLDAGLQGRIGLHNVKSDSGTLLGAMPFLRFHAFIFGNYLDPFMDFGIGAERIRYDVSGESIYKVDVGLHPGIRFPFMGSSLFYMQIGFIGYQYNTIPGESMKSRFCFFRHDATDIRVGLLFYL